MRRPDGRTPAALRSLSLERGASPYACGRFGLSKVFLGLMVIPLIGNAAEHASAVAVARKGNTDLALWIALQLLAVYAPLAVAARFI